MLVVMVTLVVLAALVKNLAAGQKQLPFWEELQNYSQNLPWAHGSTPGPWTPISIIPVQAHTAQGKDSNQLLAARISAPRAHINYSQSP